VRVRRVYLPELAAGERLLVGPDAHHLSRVLRLRPGDAVRAFDGEGVEADGRVMSIAEVAVALELEAPLETTRESPLEVTLAVALLKGDKMSSVVRHGTELGAARFIPVLTSRCDVRVLSANKLRRWRRVAQEAGKQSGRAVVPEVTELVALEELRGEEALVADPRAATSLTELALPGAGPLLVLTGPEGGLTGAELELLTQEGFRPVRLGPRILRAETAPVALLSALLLPEAR
jgi:16S rRNA (uracil1498-N3)-methyltransferase